MHGYGGGGLGTGTPSWEFAIFVILVWTPWKTTKVQCTQPVFIVGHHQPADETPCEWSFAGGPIIVRF